MLLEVGIIAVRSLVVVLVTAYVGIWAIDKF